MRRKKNLCLCDIADGGNPTSLTMDSVQWGRGGGCEVHYMLYLAAGARLNPVLDPACHAILIQNFNLNCTYRFVPHTGLVLRRARAT